MRWRSLSSAQPSARGQSPGTAYRRTMDMMTEMADQFPTNEPASQMRDAGSSRSAADGLRTSLRNVALLLGLITAMMVILGTLLAVGTFADKNMDRIHRRLDSHRKMRQPPDTTPIPIPQIHED